jgi:hypothetical protein
MRNGSFADHGRNEPLLEVVAQQRAAALEHAVDFSETGDAGVGVDEHDRVVGERGGAERRFDDAAVRAAARDQDGNTSNLGDLHARAVGTTTLIDGAKGRLYRWPIV